jgi:acetylornithine deacetylase
VTSHIDVVPPHFPYSIQGSKIYGRGSNDAKGSVATQIQAVQELRKEGKVGDGDVGLLFVVGEEVCSFTELSSL